MPLMTIRSKARDNISTAPPDGTGPLLSVGVYELHRMRLGTLCHCNNGHAMSPKTSTAAVRRAWRSMPQCESDTFTVVDSGGKPDAKPRISLYSRDPGIVDTEDLS